MGEIGAGLTANAMEGSAWWNLQWRQRISRRPSAAVAELDADGVMSTASRLDLLGGEDDEVVAGLLDITARRTGVGGRDGDSGMATAPPAAWIEQGRDQEGEWSMGERARG